MGGVVVEDQVKVEIGRRLLVDLLEEGAGIPAGDGAGTVADDRAGEHVERREQRGGAVTLVVVGDRLPGPFHRQPRAGAVERLDLALLVDRQHHALSGG